MCLREYKWLYTCCVLIILVTMMMTMMIRKKTCLLKNKTDFFSLSYVNEQVHCFHLYTQNYLDDFLIYSLNIQNFKKKLQLLNLINSRIHFHH